MTGSHHDWDPPEQGGDLHADLERDAEFLLPAAARKARISLESLTKRWKGVVLDTALSVSAAVFTTDEWRSFSIRFPIEAHNFYSLASMLYAVRISEDPDRSAPMPPSIAAAATQFLTSYWAGFRPGIMGTALFAANDINLDTTQHRWAAATAILVRRFLLAHELAHALAEIAPDSLPEFDAAEILTNAGIGDQLGSNDLDAVVPFKARRAQALEFVADAAGAWILINSLPPGTASEKEALAYRLRAFSAVRSFFHIGDALEGGRARNPRADLPVDDHPPSRVRLVAVEYYYIGLMQTLRPLHSQLDRASDELFGEEILPRTP